MFKNYQFLCNASLSGHLISVLTNLQFDLKDTYLRAWTTLDTVSGHYQAQLGAGLQVSKQAPESLMRVWHPNSA